ncbi:MAG: substrate-binding domain-containing protein [Pirellulales bacterium]
MFALIAPQLRVGLYPMLVHGFEEASAGMYHQVQVANSQNDVGRQANLVLGLIDQMVGGVAIVPPTSSPTPAIQIRQLHKNQIPVVFCHRPVEGITAPCVTFSGHEVGLKAGKALYELGHRHVACLLDIRTSLANEYEQGLFEAMRPGNGAEADMVTTIEYGIASASENARDAISRAVVELLAKPELPTAIFCGNVTDAEQVYLQAEAAGFKVPRDLSIISFGDSWRGHGLSQRISGPVVDEHALGARAAELLHQMRRGERALDNDERIEFPITLYHGETLGPAAKDSPVAMMRTESRP